MTLPGQSDCDSIEELEDMFVELARDQHAILARLRELLEDEGRAPAEINLALTQIGARVQARILNLGNPGR